MGIRPLQLGEIASKYFALKVANYNCLGYSYVCKRKTPQTKGSEMLEDLGILLGGLGTFGLLIIEIIKMFKPAKKKKKKKNKK